MSILKKDKLLSSFTLSLKASVILLLLTLQFFGTQAALAGISEELDKFQFHGFISQGYLNSSANNIYGKTKKGSFEFDEYGINFSKEINENLWVGTQIFARDLGVIDNNKVTIDWALADYQTKNWLGFRFGKLRIPIGLYNNTRDADTARTWIFLPIGNYSEFHREFTASLIGASIYGTFQNAPGGSLSYELLGGSSSIDSDNVVIQDSLKTGAAALGINTLLDVFNDVQYMIAGNLLWSPDYIPGLKLAYSGFKSEIDGGFDFASTIPGGGLGEYRTTNDMSATVASLEYNYQNFTLSTEYLRFHIHIRAHLKLASSLSFFDTLELNQDTDAYYFAGEYEASKHLRFGSYYSLYYPDRKNKNVNSDSYLKDFALTARVDLNEHLIWKLEGHRMNGTAQLTTTNNPDSKKAGWYLIASKITVSF
ncbi:Uncharacterized protein SCG7109_AB_00200 [Chlamydiales bacterium SCGC AG-110-M15]|nr:Uncharacterized protein SCG7109_AB_00200 [Chlamydiales bacterium SCGC AG-110-M15]